jgi:hypothetical protein
MGAIVFSSTLVYTKPTRHRLGQNFLDFEKSSWGVLKILTIN